MHLQHTHHNASYKKGVPDYWRLRRGGHVQRLRGALVGAGDEPHNRRRLDTQQRIISLSLYTYIYIYIYTHTYTHICICICICMCIYIYIYIYIYTYPNNAHKFNINKHVQTHKPQTNKQQAPQAWPPWTGSSST